MLGDNTSISESADLEESVEDSAGESGADSIGELTE